MAEAQRHPSYEGRQRLDSMESMKSMSSINSVILGSMTTANCEMGLLPLKLLVELQPQYLRLEGDTLISVNQNGGFNIVSDGTFRMDGGTFQINNFINRKVELRSHFEYKDYRESILSKAILFITNGKKMSSRSDSERTFALIVNTRHPRIKSQVEGSMNDVISSVMGENYNLQFVLKNVVSDYLMRQNFQLTEEDTLSFSFTFKLDVFLDIFHLLGLSKKACSVTGNIISLHCTTPDKKEKVKIFLAKMTSPLVRMGSSSDRRPSVFSLDVIDEQFGQSSDYFHETPPQSPLTQK
ncbi:hypothetical protein GDO86_004584 [Hymenochirus boettgeri]|uniref:Uncharacterized protein n=1 Tax=Hymenochirus boettgeri TaxID=247094 RepID=A0A8T2K8E4_9PIPI|nr:hypothetical protein GDO86_004584 [Hymenochirus boettgeri]